MNAAAFLSKLQQVRRSGHEWTPQCPAHDDRRASLSIAEGDDARILINCHAGCSIESIVAALGLTMKDLFPEPVHRKTIVATYDYTDEHGKLLFQTVRYEPKDFK